MHTNISSIHTYNIHTYHWLVRSDYGAYCSYLLMMLFYYIHTYQIIVHIQYIHTYKLTYIHTYICQTVFYAGVNSWQRGNIYCAHSNSLADALVAISSRGRRQSDDQSRRGRNLQTLHRYGIHTYIHTYMHACIHTT